MKKRRDSIGRRGAIYGEHYQRTFNGLISWQFSRLKGSWAWIWTVEGICSLVRCTTTGEGGHYGETQGFARWLGKVDAGIVASLRRRRCTGGAVPEVGRRGSCRRWSCGWSVGLGPTGVVAAKAGQSGSRLRAGTTRA
jgi:hypothetical protein